MNKLTLFARNKVGAVAEIAEILAKAEINIESIEADSFDDVGIITLETDAPKRAEALLQTTDFKIASNDAIMVRLKDEPGALAQISMKLKQANINLRSIRILKRADKHSLVAICTHQKEAAKAIMQDVMV